MNKRVKMCFSLSFQAHTSTPDKQLLLLTLAERLMDKFVSDNQVDNEAGMGACDAGCG